MTGPRWSVVDTDWKQQGECNGRDPAIWFPSTLEAAAYPKAFCRRCVVRETCLEFALAHGEPFGVWGGKTPLERRRMRVTA